MLLKMFLTFFKIGAFTFGGGYAMIPIIQDEVVAKKGWIDEEEFLNSIALAQGSPGAVAINTSIYVGYRVKGFPGAIVATLGTVLPSFFIILVVVRFFFQFRNNKIVEKVFLGIRPAIVALILSAVYTLMKSSKFGWKRITLSLLVAILIIFLGVSPIYLIIAGAIGSIIINKLKERDNMD